MTNSEAEILSLIDQWLECCRIGKSTSRNTVAAGIVVLDHLRKKCPVDQTEVFSAGGELIGARATLGPTLERYGIPSTYLKEVTTRQADNFARKLFELLDWGQLFEGTPDEIRDAQLIAGVDKLSQLARQWLSRQNLKVNCDQQFSPAAWIDSILQEAKGRSGGKVEQHLVGAKLERRFPDEEIANNPGHAGDTQTGRAGDFTLGSTVYHVTAAPGLPVIEKCGKNLAAGQRPVLIVPRAAISKANALADERGLEKRILIVGIEDFLALNIVELAEGRDSEYLKVLSEIIEAYNRRLREVETDLSLIIELE